MDQSGNERMTRQIVYVTDTTDKFFLGRVDLGIMPIHLPIIGEEPTRADRQLLSVDYASPSQDTTQPIQPTTLPCSAIEENIPKFKQYLIDYYGSSNFNTCEHQPLPMMERPPMHLIIDPKVKPIAYHSPIPVPIHWQDDVKAGLDRDVRLGVLEPVPVGEPVTLCHRMVICAKKNGKSRRTINLNSHATQETHHTQSPFHQDRSVPQDLLTLQNPDMHQLKERLWLWLMPLTKQGTLFWMY